MTVSRPRARGPRREHSNLALSGFREKNIHLLCGPGQGREEGQEVCALHTHMGTASRTAQREEAVPTFAANA